MHIENRDPGQQGASHILLTGVIDNPIGRTVIKNERGDIRSAGPGALVRANIVDAQATGSIGAATSRAAVELIQSRDLATGAFGAIRLTHLTAAASGGGMWLDLAGRRRDGGSGAFTGLVDSLTAAGDIDVRLNRAWVDQGAGGVPGSLHVTVRDNNEFTTTEGDYLAHFHPDPGVILLPTFDPGVFSGGSTATTETTYRFRTLAGDRGILAGGNVILAAAHPERADPRINIQGVTGLAGSGRVAATTNGDITLTHLFGDMRIGNITSSAGDVRLTVPGPGSEVRNLDLLANGKISAAGKEPNKPGGDGLVVLQVGDNITTQAGSLITAGKSITIQGDFGSRPGSPSSTIDILGRIASPHTALLGNNNEVTINLNYVDGINTQPEPLVVSDLCQALVVVDGGRGKNNRLVVDDSGDQAGGGRGRGEVTRSGVTGLDLGGRGIQYGRIQDLEIDLGQGGHELAVLSTNSTTATRVVGGPGLDVIIVAATPTGGDLSNIQGPLTVVGVAATTS